MITITIAELIYRFFAFYLMVGITNEKYDVVKHMVFKILYDTINITEYSCKTIGIL